MDLWANRVDHERLLFGSTCYQFTIQFLCLYCMNGCLRMNRRISMNRLNQNIGFYNHLRSSAMPDDPKMIMVSDSPELKCARKCLPDTTRLIPEEAKEPMRICIEKCFGPEPKGITGHYFHVCCPSITKTKTRYNPT